MSLSVPLYPRPPHLNSHWTTKAKPIANASIMIGLIALVGLSLASAAIGDPNHLTLWIAGAGLPLIFTGVLVRGIRERYKSNYCCPEKKKITETTQSGQIKKHSCLHVTSDDGTNYIALFNDASKQYEPYRKLNGKTLETPIN